MANKTAQHILSTSANLLFLSIHPFLQAKNEKHETNFRELA